ncbi:MAG TPA: MFS transporter [Candidatus Dojkabacteria bacterium]|nr:MFS transporter [Candidatus Dojkabacteria bacterium]
MINLNQDTTNIVSRPKKTLFLFGLTTFFFAISNGIYSYFAPIVITDAGFTNTEMGLLMASSSIFGIAFDLLLVKYLKRVDYFRLYLYSLSLVLLFPLFLLSHNIYILFLLAMALWSLYSNLSAFGYYDFIAREVPKKDHSSSSATLYIYNDLGYVIAPLIAGTIAITSVWWKDALIPLVTTLLALFSLITLMRYRKTSNPRERPIYEHGGGSILSFLKVCKRLWPILVLTMSLNIMESVFWIVSPILDKVSPLLNGIGGIILAVSMVPSLFVSWSVGPITKYFGKKKSAYASFFLSSFFLLLIPLTTSPIIIIILVFISNALQAITFPAMGGAIADYLKESKSNDIYILSAKDVFENIGYIVGPLLTGVMLDHTTGLEAFKYLALFGITISILLLIFSPKSIPFYDARISKTVDPTHAT